MSRQLAKRHQKEIPFPVSVDFTLSNRGLERILLGKNPQISCLSNELYHWLTTYFQGEITPFPLPLAAELSPFHWKVLYSLQSIPFGETRSYSEIATQIGCPKGARAIGNASRLNPYPLLFPCHRVLQKGGQLGGFAYGSVMKTELLDHESYIRVSRGLSGGVSS